MAFADKPLGLALLQQWLETGEAGFGPGLKGIELQQVSFVGQERADLLEVLTHRLHDGFRGALVMFQRDMRGVCVEMGNLLGHFVDVRSGQFAIGLQRAQQLALRELAHFQHVLDSRAFAAELRRVGAAGDRQYVQVQAFGQALVEAQLFIAEEFAATEFGEIKKAEVNRFFDLVGVRAGEDHPGNVGLDNLKPVDFMRV